MIYYSQYLGTQGGEYLSHSSEGFLKWISNQTVDTAKKSVNSFARHPVAAFAHQPKEIIISIINVDVN